MAWTTVQCVKCGEEYAVQMYGPTKTRRWKVDNWNGLCASCKEAQKAALIKKNKSGDLPELTGSDKQIAWAMKIRAEFIEYAEKMHDIEIKDIINECKEDHNLVTDVELIKAAVDTVLEETSAHWWIESRYELESDIVIATMVEIAGSVTGDPVKEDLQAEAEAEAVIRPPEPVTETIAVITPHKTHIEISFKERNDDFKKIIKDHGYRWNSPWEKHLSFETGTAEDRCHRIGQTKPVTYIDIICEESIDERIMNAIYSKSAVVDEFKAEIDAVKNKKGKIKELIKNL